MIPGTVPDTVPGTAVVQEYAASASRALCSRGNTILFVLLAAHGCAMSMVTYDTS